MKRSFYLTLLTAAALSSLGKTNASAQTTTNLIQNGDFSANAAGFVTFPGYLGSGSNPTTIPDFVSSSSNGGNVGLNGTGTDGAGSAFAPDGYGNPAFPSPSVFLFIQEAGTATQSINLIAGDMYTISFLAAPRARNNGTASVTLSNGSNTIYTTAVPDTSVGGTVFTQITANFTAPTTLTGSSTLMLDNLGGEASSPDFTEDFANLSLIDNSPPAAAMPEPSTYALLGVGALALCLVGRRTAKTA